MAVPNTIDDLSPVASSNGPDGATESPSVLDNYQRALGAIVRQEHNDFADATSAAKGAGQVGFGYALGYGAGTIGKWLQDLATSVGSSFIGFIQSGTGATATTLQERGRRSLSVFDFMTSAEIADVKAKTYTLNVSRAIYNAQVAAQANGAALDFPAGGYLASLSVRYSNAALLGAGSAVTTIRLPATVVAITSLSRTSNVITVNTSTAHNAWVGKAIRITGCATANFNYGYMVLSTPTPTQLTCQQLNESFADVSAGTASLYEANAFDCGELCNGNSAPIYTGLTVRGFTIDGNSSGRPTPDIDVTDWGLALTQFSQYNISDVRCINCWQGGVGLFINSNKGTIAATVENCGFSAQAPSGFDVNSSKHIVAQVVSKSCNYGARVLDNCWNIVADISIQNATVAGFIYGNQSVNESHGNIFNIAIDTCGGDGIQVGQNCRTSTIRATVKAAAGNAINEVYFATAANRPSSNNYIIASNNCGNSSALVGGDGGQWQVASYLDGRTGAAGSFYAIVSNGQRNTIAANITDSAVAQVRGIQHSATSVGNLLTSFLRNGLVSEYQDLGTSNMFQPKILRGTKTYDAPNLAGGAQTSTTITVTGATTSSGDIADVRYSQNIGGIGIFAEVTAADTVTAWLTNNTAGAIDLSSATIYAAVTKGAP